MLVKKERIPVLHMILIGIWPSAIKKFIYRLKGYSIGSNVSIAPGAVVIGKKVKLGDGVKIGFFTIIRGREITLERFVKIGAMSVIDTEKIYIDEDARINEQVYIGGMKTPQSSLHLGKRTIIMQMSYINPTLPIVIGDDSGIGGHCLFFTHGSWNSQLEGFPVRFAPITLGKKVWLPWRVFVMPGVTIGDESVIGANSLVTSDIPANSLAAGSPAKILKSGFPDRPDESAKDAMISSIFNDFTEYIKYSGFNCSKTGTDSEFTLSLSGKNKRSAIIYCLNNTNVLPAEKDSVLIMKNGSPEEMKNKIRDGFKMVLALNSNLRMGRGDAGDEITAFFSRYGVRFSRLD